MCMETSLSLCHLVCSNIYNTSQNGDGQKLSAKQLYGMDRDLVNSLINMHDDVSLICQCCFSYFLKIFQAANTQIWLTSRVMAQSILNSCSK